MLPLVLGLAGRPPLGGGTGGGGKGSSGARPTRGLVGVDLIVVPGVNMGRDITGDSDDDNDDDDADDENNPV